MRCWGFLATQRMRRSRKPIENSAKKIHPDRYTDNPLATLAEEKFREVQTAYETIMNERQNGGSHYNGYHGGYQNQNYGGGSYQNSNQSSELNIVRNYLQMGRYQEALNLLSRIQNRERAMELLLCGSA